MIGVLRRLAVVLLAALTGVVGGGAAGLVVEGDRAPRPAPSPSSPAPAGTDAHPPLARPIEPDTLLAWTPGGLPPGLARAVRRLPGVDHVAAVVSGVAWLDRTVSADGRLVGRAPPGMGYPVEVAGADLRRYAPFLAPADRAVLPLLARGQAALGEMSAEVRGLGRGGTLVFGARRVRVAGILPDPAVGANEVFVSRRTAAALGITRERYLLVDPAPGARRQDLTRAIRRLLPPGFLLRVRGPGETPFFRHGDAVLPPVQLKLLFGEFAARPLPTGLIVPDPRWVRRHIVAARVPILGTVTCHRTLIPQLRGALEELAREGLAGLVDPGGYAGCYAPRYINRDPRSALSHHSWGVALDLNARANAYGRTPHQDPRLVAVFERWGFTWGGHWLLPDGMHFEFVRFPSGA